MLRAIFQIFKCWIC